MIEIAFAVVAARSRNTGAAWTAAIFTDDVILTNPSHVSAVALSQPFAREITRQTGAGCAIDVFEDLALLWQHEHLVPGAELIGLAELAIARDRGGEDRLVRRMALRPVLHVLQRQEVAECVGLEFRLTSGIAGLLKAQRAAAGGLGTVLQVSHAAFQWSAQIAHVILGLRRVAAAPERGGAD